MEGVGIAFDVVGIDDILVEGLTLGFLIHIGIEPFKLPVQIGSTKRHQTKDGPNDEGHDQDPIQQHSHPRIPPVDKIQENIDN
jgi:hypothetical protein